jgi:hypothetical protein
LIPTGERSSLLTHIATMESVSLCERTETLTVFVEPEAEILGGVCEEQLSVTAGARDLTVSGRQLMYFGDL